MSRIEGIVNLRDWDRQQSAMPVLNMLQADLYQKRPHNSVQRRPMTADAKGLRSRDSPSIFKVRQNSARRSSDVPKSAQSAEDCHDQQRVIERLVSQLPKELQISIVEAVSIMATSMKRLKIVAECQNVELQEMRASHVLKNDELRTTARKCEDYRERLATLEKKYYRGAIDLKDDRVNKNLIVKSHLCMEDFNSYDSFQIYSGDRSLHPDQSDEKKLLTTSTSKSATFQNTQIRSLRKRDRSGASATPPFSGEKLKSTLGSISDKQETNKFRSSKEFNLDGETMRNTILVITREKYRLTKKVEALENRVKSLKECLQLSEMQCRHLHINLAEFTGDSKDNDFSFNLQATNSLTFKKKSFGPQDDIFRMMIEKRAINPVDSILQCKRMMEWMTSLPKETFQLSLVMSHITSREMIKILDVDMIFIFIIDTNNENYINKYSVRNDNYESHDLTDFSCIVKEVLKNEKTMKFAEIKSSSEFNMSIDGCPGIIVHNLLSVPIKNEKSGEVIGAIHLINKFNGKVAFTDLDEMISILFASMTVSAILGCQKYQLLNYRTDVLTSVLSSPSSLLSLTSSKDSMYKKNIYIGEVLYVLENCFQVALKCLKVKAFLLSDCIYGLQSGLLISRKIRGKNSPKLRNDAVPLLDYNSINIGIAGYVMTTKKLYIETNGENNIHYHPLVDLDSKGISSFTVPLFNIDGDILVCVQMVLGSGSPKIHLADSRAQGITFEQALQWLILTISTPLQLLIEKIYENNGKKKIKLRNGNSGDDDNDDDDVMDPTILKCESSDTMKEEMFASFSLQEQANKNDERNHLLSLGIHPSEESCKNESKKENNFTSDLYSDNTKFPRMHRRVSV